MASRSPGPSRPSSKFAWAAASFTIDSAAISAGKKLSVTPEMLKFSTARSVWMP